MGGAIGDGVSPHSRTLMAHNSSIGFQPVRTDKEAGIQEGEPVARRMTRPILALALTLIPVSPFGPLTIRNRPLAIGQSYPADSRHILPSGAQGGLGGFAQET
jgi:hypothetical protein